MEKRTILIADDERDIVAALEKKLTEAGYEICTAHDGYAALSKARVVNPDLILLDIMIRGMHGIEIKKRLALEEATVNIPVIFLTDKSTTDQKIKDYLLKADDYFMKPFNLPEVVARIDAIATRRKQYEQLFMTDALTGLNNLHVFKKNFEAFFNVARRYKRVFSIAVIDVNDFKAINDTWGHPVGDLVLKTIADCMKKEFREPDLLIRYGGDEFVILFPETGEKQAVEAVERLRAKVAGLGVPAARGGPDQIFFTISAGAASFHEHCKRPEELFHLADQRMYVDKKRQKDPVKTDKRRK
jgi:two-component system cell cycle response regulator